KGKKMSTPRTPTRRDILATTATAGAMGLLGIQPAQAAESGAIHKEQKMTATDGAVRPFHFHASDEALADLKRRVQATKWPDREQVPDATQGVQLETMQKLAKYWATDHDWRKCEARINALPNFVTEIDGLDIH